MEQKSDRVEVTVEEVRDSAPSGEPERRSVVIDTESKVNGELRDTSIEVRDVEAPAVAAALLNAELPAAPRAPDLPIAVRCLAAGIVHAANVGQVRLHLQFESGQVLPIEMSRDAAAALARGLSDHMQGSQA